MCDTKQTDLKPEETFPPVFWTELTENDVEMLEKINSGRKFNMSLIYAVARRCAAGWPQTVVCRPVTSEGVPFPTIFWLTCPYLCQKCSELESEHKIHELETYFSLMDEDAVAWHREYASVRDRLLALDKNFKRTKNYNSILQSFKEYGVGGINFAASQSAVKCLHLQVATLLGLGKHPASEWLKQNFGGFECGQTDHITCRYIK